MSKKGSALMQVLVMGLIIVSLAVFILRYAITRSANLSRTNRILQSQIIADSCLDQYMFYQSMAELNGTPYVSTNTAFNCLYYNNEGGASQITMWLQSSQDIDDSAMTVTTFTVPVRTD